MDKWVRILLIIILGVIALAFMGTLVTVIYKWPHLAFSVIYLVVCLVFIVRHINRVFFMSWRMDKLDTFVVDLFNTDFSSDSSFTRLRRRLSASLTIIANSVLWPTIMVSRLAFRPFSTRNALGQLVPKRPKTILYYLNFVLGAFLFALLSVSILILSTKGHTDRLLTCVLFLVLAVNLFSRHAAMLIFPDDRKAAIRRMMGDPRVFFLIVFCIDTFAFAVIVHFLTLSSETGGASLNGFTRAIVDLLSVSEVRNLWEEMKKVYKDGGTHIGADIFALLANVTPSQAVKMLCSVFVYLNLVRMLFPLNSWKQTDEDLKFLVRSLQIFGTPKQAQVYLERIQDYDVETAHLDAMVAASRGDLRAGAEKIRWAHARDALPEDPDLVFLDTVAPTILMAKNGFDIGRCVAFALETKVSDAVLTVAVFGRLAFGQIDPREVLDIIKVHDCLEDYPLSATMLELSDGDQESAIKRLDTYVAGDIVSRCTTILLNEVSSSISLPSPSPSVQYAAEEVAQAIEAVDIGELSLSQQFTLVSILTMFRCMVAVIGGSTTSLESHTSTILTAIREHHPSHRNYASFLSNYGRVAEVQARREAKRSSD